MACNGHARPPLLPALISCLPPELTTRARNLPWQSYRDIVAIILSQNTVKGIRLEVKAELFGIENVPVGFGECNGRWRGEVIENEARDPDRVEAGVVQAGDAPSAGSERRDLGPVEVF